MQRLAPPLASSILEVIGHTPMVELQRIVQNHGLRGRLLAKLEYLNPSLSKKDRIALEIIRQAKQTGRLQPGQTVVELTSGNTGTGLAIVCQALGHPFVAVMSRGNTIERARMMQAFGARVELVNQAPESTLNQVSGNDLALVETRTRQLVEELRAFRADQFFLQANVLAHYGHTGPEMWEQSGQSIEVFVDFVGTAGSFTGISRYLREVNPKVRCYLLEPASVPALAQQPLTDPGHPIQGGGYNMPNLPLLDRSLITDFLTVTGAQAIQAARELAQHEGIFGGFSSGAHLAAAIDLLRNREAGATIAFLICDSGLKYLSTNLYSALSSS